MSEDTDTQKEMQELRGKPIEIRIFGQTKIVERMSIDTQMQVMEIWQKMGETAENESEMRQGFSFMAMIVGFALGCSKEEIKSKATMPELLESFPKIWEQNEFSFLLQRAKKAMDVIKAAG